MPYDAESGSLIEGDDNEIITGLPDLGGMPLDELMVTTDPLVVAACNRVVQQVLAGRPTDGHC